MIDTHAHVYSEEFLSDRKQVLLSAKERGISHIFMPNVDSLTIDSMFEVERDFDFCYSMMGLHPCHVKQDFRKELDIVDNWFSQRNFIGVGETGIDLYWDKTYVEEQKIAFEYQIDIAINTQLPIVIHSRDSLDMTIEIIEKRQNGNLTGVFHCFNGTIEQARRIENAGFYIGLGGVVSYKSAKFDEVLGPLGLNFAVLETDSPYLAPVPHRGQRNEPSFLIDIVTKISTFIGLEREQVIAITTKNALSLFNKV